jgi:hypothetical protein
VVSEGQGGVDDAITPRKPVDEAEGIARDAMRGWIAT